MNHRQLAQIGLGLLGIWALLYAVAGFIQITAVVLSSSSPLVLAVVVPIGLMLGLSYLLIFHNAKVATAIFPDVEGETGDAHAVLPRTLVALTGALLLVQAAPAAVNAILTFFSIGEIDPTLRGRMMRAFIGSLVPIGAGIYLIVRPERFLDYLERPIPAPTIDVE